MSSSSIIDTVDTSAFKTQNPFNASWQQTMLRVRDPEVSVAFYEKHFGFTLVDKYDFPEMEFALYFLATLPNGEKVPGAPGSQEAHDWLWNTQHVVLELTHNYGTEKEEKTPYVSGNEEPYRGFGHIAVNVDDVYAVSAELEKNGVTFKKRPDEGRMKGLAFAYDPDGYWIEVVRRADKHDVKEKFNFSQTMIRVFDPKKSLAFYVEQLGMTLIAEKHFPAAKFSLYFLATLSEEQLKALPKDTKSAEAFEWFKGLHQPVLELTWNHDQSKPYANGNDEEKRGFGHIGFLVDDPVVAVEALEKAGAKVIKHPNGGKMRGLGFVTDPDGYRVEIIQRGLKVE
eukprot:TRINITY_DN66802_c1_g1_i1.p1 TRINITY_DN66802_c1_g1~~TRINITY_DN66802_c1_g1_i1.p1  ORF type:complete len:341 (+),score=187.82 TRINITY_DN66802_c1_g1_i1:120-1142(+)